MTCTPDCPHTAWRQHLSCAPAPAMLITLPGFITVTSCSLLLAYPPALPAARAGTPGHQSRQRSSSTPLTATRWCWYCLGLTHNHTQAPLTRASAHTRHHHARAHSLCLCLAHVPADLLVLQHLEVHWLYMQHTGTGAVLLLLPTIPALPLLLLLPRPPPATAPAPPSPCYCSCPALPLPHNFPVAKPPPQFTEALKSAYPAARGCLPPAAPPAAASSSVAAVPAAAAAAAAAASQPKLSAAWPASPVQPWQQPLPKTASHAPTCNAPRMPRLQRSHPSIHPPPAAITCAPCHRRSCQRCHASAQAAWAGPPWSCCCAGRSPGSHRHCRWVTSRR
jgi:hypothetical protein